MPITPQILFLGLNFIHLKYLLLTDWFLTLFEKNPSSGKLHYNTNNFIYLFDWKLPGKNGENIIPFLLCFLAIKNHIKLLGSINILASNDCNALFLFGLPGEDISLSLNRRVLIISLNQSGDWVNLHRPLLLNIGLIKMPQHNLLQVFRQNKMHWSLLIIRAIDINKDPLCDIFE